MHFGTHGGQGQPPHAPLQTYSTTGGPPPPPSKGAKKLAKRLLRNTPNRPELFDLTINDDMGDAGDDTAKVLAENERAKADKRVAIAQQIANHLGPQAEPNKSYVASLTELSMNKKGGTRARGKQPEAPDEEMASGSQQHPPPPPPGQSPAITT